MATQGNLYLDIQALLAVYEKIKEYETVSQEAFYTEYKNAYKLSKTNYFRGQAANAYKDYITEGPINIITEFLDLTMDMTMIIQLIGESFFQVENTFNGVISEKVLDYIKDSLSKKKDILDDSVTDIEADINAASKYIKTTPLHFDKVWAGYTNTNNVIQKIRQDIYDVDDETKKDAEDLLERINALKKFITDTMTFCYNEGGSLNTDNLPKLKNQSWYYQAGNAALYTLLQQDPFKYAAGEVTVKEDQWAAGLCADIYVYAGYKFLTASGEAGVEDGTAYAKGKAALFSANGYAQFTDYLNANVDVKVFNAEGDAKAGFGDKYVGFSVSGEIGILDADGKVILGTEECNAFLEGEVKVLYADGKAAFEFEEDGQFAIGVKGSATAASAEGKAGFSFLKYKSKDSFTGEEKSLFGAKIGAKANAGASGAIWIESETAIETDYVNINATTIDIDAEFLIGGEIELTIPTLYFKWPW